MQYHMRRVRSGSCAGRSFSLDAAGKPCYIHLREGIRMEKVPFDLKGVRISDATVYHFYRVDWRPDPGPHRGSGAAGPAHELQPGRAGLPQLARRAGDQLPRLLRKAAGGQYLHHQPGVPGRLRGCVHPGAGRRAGYFVPGLFQRAVGDLSVQLRGRRNAAGKIPRPPHRLCGLQTGQHGRGAVCLSGSPQAAGRGQF